LLGHYGEDSWQKRSLASTWWEKPLSSEALAKSTSLRPKWLSLGCNALCSAEPICLMNFNILSTWSFVGFELCVYIYILPPLFLSKSLMREGFTWHHHARHLTKCFNDKFLRMPSSIISEWYKGGEVGKELALKKNLQDCFLWSSNLNAKLS
jgi:hypothetical protein